MSKLAIRFPDQLGWICYVVFVDEVPPERDNYEFIIPSSRERCWVVPFADRPELVPYMASGVLNELTPEGFAVWFKRWAAEALSTPPGYTVH